MLIAYLAVFLIGQLALKNLISRPRPSQIDQTFALLVARPSSSSFPSTHSAWAFGAATAIFAQHRRIGAALGIALGGRGNTQALFNDPTIAAIAQAHGKTSAQVFLRWHLQAGNIAIPGSCNPDHILENISIFDFELTDDEMAQMTSLDRNDRFADY